MFDIPAFQKRRQSKFGSEIYYFHEIDSTNAFAEQLAREGCPEGTIVIADSQSAGRGRNKNQWHSPPSVNLYFSIVLRPDISCLNRLPFVCGLAIANTLKQQGLLADLKWPNDILINNKKISGVLVQTAVEENALLFAVAGFGLNINATEFPFDLQSSATSMTLETGTMFSRESILAAILFEFETLYQGITLTPWIEFAREVEIHSSYLNGCEVLIQQEGRVLHGITRGLDAQGGLILETENGNLAIYSGDVQACRKK